MTDNSSKEQNFFQDRHPELYRYLKQLAAGYGLDGLREALDEIEGEQSSTAIPANLEDLKRAIKAVGTRPFTDGDYFTTARLCDWQSRRADAWRTAFEWRDGPEYAGPLPGEYHVGMALIREKLK